MLRSSATAKRIHQFTITLLDVEPAVWRRIQVPERYRFWDLHVAIQDAMGWQDYHLHLFRVKMKHGHKITQIGIPSDDSFDWEPELQAGWEIALDTVLYEVGSVFEYEYDFGDCWVHEIVHEAVALKERGITYPRCIDGARACPPEDCGGPPGYERLLDILADPSDEEYEDMRTWAGDFHPERFDPVAVRFHNPTARLRRLIG